MSEPFVLAIDQGTTNSKALLFDQRGVVVTRASRPVGLSCPRPGWVEEDAWELWTTVQDAIAECVAGVDPKRIAAIGVTNQRESVVVWDRRSGKPAGPCVIWQCRRSEPLCEELRRAGHAAQVRLRTGLTLDPMFSGTKALWLLQSIPDGIERARRGELCIGTVDSWMVWNLTGGSVFATDVSNASRTLLLDIAAAEWSGDMLEVFGIPAAALPQVRPSKAGYGCTCGAGVLPDGIPIASAIGDSHAALFGHCAFEPGAVKATYGTGSSLMTVTRGPVVSDFLSTTIAWGGVDGRITHALEGNILATGSAVQWFGELLGSPDPARTVAAMADSAGSSEGLYMVPAFVGLAAPHWSPSARAIITGISRGTTAAQVARAVVESIAYQVCDVFDLMEAEAGRSVETLLADGGASANDSLMQFQADIIGRRVVRSTSADLSARGAAWLAGLHAGLWRSLDELRSLRDETTPFEPRMSASERHRLRDGWRGAVDQTLYAVSRVNK